MTQWLQQPWVWPVIGAAGAVILVAIVIRLLRRKPERTELEAPDLSIDVRTLPAQGPDLAQPHLEVYGVPVRLAVIVLAPVGRDHALPPGNQLPALLNQLLPHLQSVIEENQPSIRRWPAQLSVQGFKHAFFNQVTLPGDRGKGSPWCSVAGRFSVGRESFLVGLVASAASDNSLSQVFVEHEGRWLDAVRVKSVPASE